MKICISSTGQNENSQVSPIFGRCPYFVIYDEKEEKFEVIENDSWQAPRGAGIAATQKLVDLGCQVLITGNVGPNAFYALQAAGIKVMAGVLGKTIKQVLKEYREGKLSEAQMPTGRFGPCMGRGFGKGRGLGMGRRGRR